ncbi:hypothetical protein, partial [Archangium violaceum]|uniref:hypothetical protein n=1 Tax=Archangium violaceum TaxID=83451 RepID=UPI001363165A
TKEHRVGALRLLDKKVRAIRRGEVKSIPANTRIFPVLITFDELCENPALYQWIEKRCSEMGILQPPDTAAVTLVTLDEFEAMMSLASKGHPVSSFLAKKTSKDWRYATTQALLRDLSPDGSLLRLKHLQERFNHICDRAQERLFGLKTEVDILKSDDVPDLPGNKS